MPSRAIFARFKVQGKQARKSQKTSNLELADSGFHQYCWKQLLTVSAEDCAGIVTQEIASLQNAFHQVNQGKASKLKGRVFIAKAVIILCQAKKCRDADHLVCFVHDADMLDAEKLAKALDEA